MRYRSSIERLARNFQQPATVQGIEQEKVLQGEDRWSEGPEDGGTARTAAARCASELAGDGAAHLALVESGLAEALALKAAELVRHVAHSGHVQTAVMIAFVLSWTRGRRAVVAEWGAHVCQSGDMCCSEAHQHTAMVLSPHA